MKTVWYVYLGWVAVAGLLGFTLSGIFAGRLHLPRSIYLIPYVVFSGLFIYAYVKWSGLSIANLFRHNWYWGVIGGILFAAFTVKNVLSQPVSPRSEGFALVFDLAWSGILYGLVDALFLSVLPIVATWQAFTLLNWTSNWPGKILVGALALIASIFVTVSYHFGYPEYRGGGMMGPVIGNTAMSLSYLLTNNPLSAIFSHVAMHVAGVLHGPASVTQLPPHY